MVQFAQKAASGAVKGGMNSSELEPVVPDGIEEATHGDD